MNKACPACGGHRSLEVDHPLLATLGGEASAVVRLLSLLFELGRERHRGHRDVRLLRRP